MMKLKIEQVVEYLQAGEKDQQIKRMLRSDPDGPELLRQAKLIYELLGRLTDTSGSDDLFAGEPAKAMSFITRDASWDLSEDRISFDEKGSEPVMRTEMKAMPAMSRLASRAAGPHRVIGGLVIRFKDDRIELSVQDRESTWGRPPDTEKFPEVFHKPVERTRTYYQSVPRASRFATDGGLTVSGQGLKMGFPESMSASLPLWTHIIDTKLQIPARGLDLTFLPDTGRAVKVATGTDGRAQMPVPEQSGVLRIETTPPQFLRIEIETTETDF